MKWGREGGWGAASMTPPVILAGTEVTAIAALFEAHADSIGKKR